MATQAQINANRRNARRSTGPRTEAGKTRVSRNAVRHGLRSKEAVEPDPSDAEFQELLANWEAALEPANDLERDAALRIALTLWRYHRVCRLEVELLSKADNDSLPGTLGYIGRLLDDASRAVVRAIQHGDYVRQLSFSLPQLPQGKGAVCEQTQSAAQEENAVCEQSQSWPARRCRKRAVAQTNPIPGPGKTPDAQTDPISPPSRPAPPTSAPLPPPTIGAHRLSPGASLYTPNLRGLILGPALLDCYLQAAGHDINHTRPLDLNDVRGSVGS